jgi:hypothetical protein
METNTNHENDENESEKQSDVQADFHKEEIFIDPECYNDDLEEVIIIIH